MKKIAQIGRKNVSISCTSASSLSKEDQLKILQELKKFLQSYNKEEFYDIAYDAGYPGYFITLKQNSEINLRGYLYMDLISSTDKNGNLINIPVVYLKTRNMGSTKYSSAAGPLCYYMDNIGNYWNFNFNIIYYDKDNYILFSEILNDYNEDKIIRSMAFSIFTLGSRSLGYEGDYVSGTSRLLVHSPRTEIGKAYDVMADVSTYNMNFNNITILCPLMLQEVLDFGDHIILPYQFLSSSHQQYRDNTFYYNESYEFFQIKKYIFYYCPSTRYPWCYLIGVQND